MSAPPPPPPPRENVWDYPRPPALQPTSRRLRVELHGAVVADTARGHRVLETSHPPTYYIPREDVAAEFLRPSAGGSTLCEWKGRATYWDVQVPGHPPVARRAWSYEAPTPAFAAIAGHVSFYASPFECYVDGERVAPQPGDFYGGWLTKDVDGGERGVKGGPGTWGW